MPIKFRKNPRLRNYDYKNGYFFVTNQSDKSQPIFHGEVLELIKEQINHLNSYQGIKVEMSVVMPTHIHVILVFQNADLPLSKVWGQFKGRTSYYGKKTGLMSDAMWQKNYYEHVIRSEKALNAIRRYVLDNPLKLNIPFDEIYELLGEGPYH